MEASAAACWAEADLAKSRGSLTKTKTFPTEKDITGEEARIGDPELSDLCRTIIDGQQKEIDQMRSILERLP